MTVSNTNVLDFLGKQISFVHTVKVYSDVYSLDINGTVTGVLINLTGFHEVCIDDSQFYFFSEMSEIKII